MQVIPKEDEGGDHINTEGSSGAVGGQDERHGTEHTVEQQCQQEPDQQPQPKQAPGPQDARKAQDAGTTHTYTHRPGTAGATHTHTHTPKTSPIPPKKTKYHPSLTLFPRIIASNADNTTQGEAGCLSDASEPFSLSGGHHNLVTFSTLDDPCGDSALASSPKQCIMTKIRSAETCIGNRPQEALGGSLAAQSVDVVGYCIDMVDHIKKYCIENNTGQDIDFDVEKMMEDLDKLQYTLDSLI